MPNDVSQNVINNILDKHKRGRPLLRQERHRREFEIEMKFKRSVGRTRKNALQTSPIKCYEVPFITPISCTKNEIKCIYIYN